MMLRKDLSHQANHKPIKCKSASPLVLDEEGISLYDYVNIPMLLTNVLKERIFIFEKFLSKLDYIVPHFPITMEINSKAPLVKIVPSSIPIEMLAAQQDALRDWGGD
ncbi:hypothetical protein VNO77_22468 [Canavalia gladiata]|uniref:Uncharacterized protein n=1 Tax=Canavalia gladiata TaxID=3824 RepID=A0AAN9L5W8_CANGL